LPTYKGSTTYYYEILKKNSISYSVIFQNSKIDNGGIIYSCTYNLKKIKVEKHKLDHVYDPYLRSIVLLNVILKLKKLKKLNSKKQAQKNSKTYYIIHPVLKHISILSKK
jgi:methionyl-tRNA formyltransferase